MADVMLSYARTDQPTAHQLADCLTADGFEVWFDRDIPPGREYGAFIDEQLGKARAVVVLWSRASASSRWVVAEASEAAAKAKLVPVTIDDAVIPLEFRPIQTANLVGWHGDRSSPGYRALLAALRAGSSPVFTQTPHPPGLEARAAPQNRSSRGAIWLIGSALVAVVLALVLLTRSPGSSEPTTVPIDSRPPASTVENPVPFDEALLSAPFENSSYPVAETDGEPGEFADEITTRLVDLAACGGESSGEIVSITGENPATIVIDVSIPCADSSDAFIPYSGGLRYEMDVTADQSGVWTVTEMMVQVFCPRGVDRGALCNE